jgi:hypothetical protein
MSDTEDARTRMLRSEPLGEHTKGTSLITYRGVELIVDKPLTCAIAGRYAGRATDPVDLSS